jgi:Carboxypeptidase regulatory-like domain
MSRVSLVAFVVTSSVAPAFAQVQGSPTPGVTVRPSPPRQPAPRDRASSATGTAKVRGAVVSDDGRPLRRVVVSVTAPELREPRNALTDLSGRYEVADLPAGRYAVAVEYLDSSRRYDRAYLEELSRDVVRFSIREEESKVLDLKFKMPH